MTTSLLRATANPAKVVKRLPGMGTLAVGGPVDLALLEIVGGRFQLVDSQKKTVATEKKIVSRLTICRGKRLLAPV